MIVCRQVRWLIYRTNLDPVELLVGDRCLSRDLFGLTTSFSPSVCDRLLFRGVRIFSPACSHVECVDPPVPCHMARPSQDILDSRVSSSRPCLGIDFPKVRVP